MADGGCLKTHVLLFIAFQLALAGGSMRCLPVLLLCYVSAASAAALTPHRAIEAVRSELRRLTSQLLPSQLTPPQLTATSGDAARTLAQVDVDTISNVGKNPLKDRNIFAHAREVRDPGQMLLAGWLGGRVAFPATKARYMQRPSSPPAPAPLAPPTPNIHPNPDTSPPHPPRPRHPQAEARANPESSGVFNNQATVTAYAGDSYPTPRGSSGTHNGEEGSGRAKVNGGFAGVPINAHGTLANAATDTGNARCVAVGPGLGFIWWRFFGRIEGVVIS